MSRKISAVFNQAVLALLLSIASIGSIGSIGFANEGTSKGASETNEKMIRSSDRHVIVRLKDHVGQTFSEALFRRSRFFQRAELLIPSMNLYVVELQKGFHVQSAVRALKQYEEVEYVQEDHFVQLRSELPNDTEFSKQWSLYSPDTQVDIGAAEAWSLGKGGKDMNGNDIVIAIVDGGMDITHPDLLPNLWINQNEIPGNGIDDDQNGYVDDIHGWNAFNNTGNIISSSHGTHVAGIAGAAGNNGLHIAGINWDVKLMPIPGSSGRTSTIARAYGYALEQKRLWLETSGKKGANVVVTNSSFGIDFANCTSGEYPIWNDIYTEMGKYGILSAAAAPNRNVDVDQVGDVPTGCDSEFIISVTNTQRNDTKYSSAGYGVKHIDLGAPGTAILSTVPGNSVRQMTGTSMAAPHVAGAVAFLHSVASPDLTSLSRNSPQAGALMIKQILLETVEPNPSLEGVTVSGGRLHLGRAAKAAASF